MRSYSYRNTIDAGVKYNANTFLHSHLHKPSHFVAVYRIRRYVPADLCLLPNRQRIRYLNSQQHPSPVASPHPQRSHDNGHLARRPRPLQGPGTQSRPGSAEGRGRPFAAGHGAAQAPTPLTRSKFPQTHIPKTQPQPFTKHAIILSQHLYWRIAYAQQWKQKTHPCRQAKGGPSVVFQAELILAHLSPPGKTCSRSPSA